MSILHWLGPVKSYVDTHPDANKVQLAYRPRQQQASKQASKRKRAANGVVAKQRKHATWQTTRPWTPSPADHASEPTTSTGGIKGNAMRDDGGNDDGCQECDVVSKP